MWLLSIRETNGLVEQDPEEERVSDDWSHTSCAGSSCVSSWSGDCSGNTLDTSLCLEAVICTCLKQMGSGWKIQIPIIGFNIWRSNMSMLPLHWCSHLFPSSLTDFSDSGLSHKTLGTDYLQQMVQGSCWQSCWSGPRWCWTRGPGVEQEALIEHEQLMSCLLTCVSSSPWTCACYQKLVSSPDLVVAECHHLALE